MLDQVLGAQNSIVRVAATLDFSKSVVESKNIDPESATVISEEKLEETNDAQSNANSSVKNYELSEKRERSEKSVGEVSYLTVSVILNQRTPPVSSEDPAVKPEPVPYSPTELTEIESLVKNAVGFREERGDRFAIHQTVFDSGPAFAEEAGSSFYNENIELYLRYGLMTIALVMALLLIRSASKKAVEISAEAKPSTAFQAAIGARAPGTLPNASFDSTRLLEQAQPEMEFQVEDIYQSKLSSEAKARMKAKHKLFDEIKDQIAATPENTAELIKSWMLQDLERADVPAAAEA